MIKRFCLSRIFKLRDKISLAARPYIGRNIVGENVQDLTADIYQVLPPLTSRDALFETCRVLAGKVLSLQLAAEFSWRVAGNIEKLLASEPIVPWSRQIADEWMPVQVLRLDPAYVRGKSGFTVRFRALAGSYCPGIFEQFLSRASCAAISRIIGFSRIRPYTNSLHLTNLRFVVFVEALRSEGQPYFKEVTCPASMKAHNVEIIDVRVRNNPCLLNYDHMCENCAVGYTTCPMAIFQQSLVTQHCSKCDAPRPFDIGRSAEMCLACWQAQQFTQVKAGH